jgi:hypothetical protein
MVLLAIFLSILYGKTFKKQRNKALKLKRTFNRLSRKHKLSMDEVDIFNSKVIGLDKKSGKLLLFEYMNNRLRQICISLKELESHRIVKVMDKTEGYISELVMEFRLGDQKPAYFTFYDSTKDSASAFSSLRDKAKYWDAKIHSHASTFSSTNRFEYVV